MTSAVREPVGIGNTAKRYLEVWALAAQGTVGPAGSVRLGRNSLSLHKILDRLAAA